MVTAVVDGGRARRRQDALDGVRALALCLVLLFHAGFRWMPAGYVGVSVFFTLSGYLITDLLLGEHETTGRIGLGAFYARRWKRLLPASLLCLVAIAALGSIGAFSEVADLRDDLSAAALQVFNWRELGGGSSYTALFDGSPERLSPVTHFWSLAIEEQFYLLWPLALLGLLWYARRRSVAIIRPLAALTVLFAAVAPIIGSLYGPDAAYWSTPSRFGEILVGACVACALRSASLRSRLVLSARWGSLAAVSCLCVVVAAAVVLPSDDGPAFHGWMSVFALVSAGLIIGLQSPGPVRRVLSWRPLVLLGLVSYGAYLYHWPVFVLLEARGWTMSSPVGFGVAILITLSLAALSYQVVEQPIRRRSWSIPRVAGAAAMATAAALVVISIAPSSRGFLVADSELLDAASIKIDASTGPLRIATATTTTTTTMTMTTTMMPTVTTSTVTRPAVATPTVAAPPSTPAPSPVPATEGDAGVVTELPAPPNRPVRILVVGDSTAFYVAHGLARWAVDHPQFSQLDLLWTQGFGLITTGAITAWDASAFVDRSAELLATDLPAMISRVQPDVVVLMTTIDDVLDRRWDDTEGELTTSDPRFRERMLAAYRDTTSSLLEQGVPSVVWIIPPVPTGRSDADELQDPGRFEVQHEVIRQVVAESSPAATIVDLDQWMIDTGRDVDPSWRPDGTHLTDESAQRIAEMMLGPTLVRIATG